MYRQGRETYSSCDLDLMTLMSEVDLDIMMTYTQKMKFLLQPEETYRQPRPKIHVSVFSFFIMAGK